MNGSSIPSPAPNLTPKLQVFPVLYSFLKIVPQKPRILRDYHIRLTREYTDGGMDSHAEQEGSKSSYQLGARCNLNVTKVFPA